MPVIETRFHVAPDKARGPAALELALEALSVTLPYVRITAITLDHRVFPVDADRFPATIWQRLLANRAWHPKLVSHLVENLAGTDERRQVLQDKFYRLLAKSQVKVGLSGTMMYDDESTPGLLTSVVFPKMRELGCRLRVDAFSDLLRAAYEPTADSLYVVMMQRQLYGEQVSTTV